MKNIQTLLSSPAFNRFKLWWNGSFIHGLPATSYHNICFTELLWRQRASAVSHSLRHLAEHSIKRCQVRPKQISWAWSKASIEYYQVQV